MNIDAIQVLLTATMGLNPASIGPSPIVRAVRRRMELIKITSMDDYYNLLQNSHDEMSHLIEAVVIPETWFFRDQHPFAALQRYVTQEWLPAHPEETLRILSAPCSTGEEPYTIAMALLDIGFPIQRCHIDALDISEKNLAVARRGVYGQNSFRGEQLDYRDRHFSPQGGNFIINPNVRTAVNFVRGNLLHPFLPIEQIDYDIIFCRNLMIYFDRTTQDRCIENLDRMLSPTGMLFVGHAETGLFLNRWFESARYPMAFAFRRSDDERRRVVGWAQPQAEQRNSSTLNRRKAPLKKPPSHPALPTRALPEPKPTAPPAASRAEQLDEAFNLANEGHLVEAAALVERMISEFGPDAQAFYLLGVVREAAGNREQAEELLRKAVYLSPNHYEALSHLALMREAEGDTEEAQRLKQRAQRIRGPKPGAAVEA